MAFYNDMRKLADNLITQYGNSFELKKPGTETYNPVTKKTSKTYTTYKGKCVMRPYTAEMIGSLENIINVGDVQFKCVMQDMSVIPTEGVDYLIFGGIKYDIVSVGETNPSGSTVLIHTLQCRRSSSKK